MNVILCFRPLAGCGLFLLFESDSLKAAVSVPLRGVGCFILLSRLKLDMMFPSPCGVWVVSIRLLDGRIELGFRPLAGCGLFRQSCTFFLVQQEKELSTLLFYCIILADVYQ